LRALVRGWNEFWFRPQSTATPALLRIVVGGLTVVWTLVLASNFDDFFGRDGVAGGPTLAPLLAGLLLVAAICLTVGFRTRTAAAAVLFCLLALYRVNPLVWNTGDTLLRHLVLFLALSSAGAAVSVDSARRGRGRQWEFPLRQPWALRLVQVQVALMYVVSFTWKLKGSTWRGGTAVSYVLRIPPDQRFVLPSSVTSSLTWAHVFTWGTLVVEAAIPLLVWNRRTRPFVLAAGAALHLSIDLTLRTGFFTWIVLASYVSFVPPETAERILRRFSRQRYSTVGPGGR
jgi:uncharacterized membrane protein YphA (DoxX/SURF4 family)